MHRRMRRRLTKTHYSPSAAWRSPRSALLSHCANVVSGFSDGCCGCWRRHNPVIPTRFRRNNLVFAIVGLAGWHLVPRSTVKRGLATAVAAEGEEGRAGTMRRGINWNSSRRLLAFAACRARGRKHRACLMYGVRFGPRGVVRYRRGELYWVAAALNGPRSLSTERPVSRADDRTCQLSLDAPTSCATITLIPPMTCCIPVTYHFSFFDSQHDSLHSMAILEGNIRLCSWSEQSGRFYLSQSQFSFDRMLTWRY